MIDAHGTGLHVVTSKRLCGTMVQPDRRPFSARLRRPSTGNPARWLRTSNLGAQAEDGGHAWATAGSRMPSRLSRLHGEIRIAPAESCEICRSALLLYLGFRLTRRDIDGCVGVELRHEGDPTDCVREWAAATTAAGTSSRWQPLA